MPTLYRLVFFSVTFAGCIYAAMLALVIFVDPGERSVIIHIPPGSVPVTERPETDRQ